MDVLKTNDFELLYLISRRNDVALNILLKKYEIIVLSILKKYNISESLKEDLIQECMIVIINSIKKFDIELNYLFSTYILFILKRKINRLLDKEFEYNRYIYMMKTHYEKNYFNDSYFYYDSGVEKIIEEQLLEKLMNDLTKDEKLVFNDIMIDRMTISDFSNKYNIEVKKIYNLIQFIKRKYKKLSDNCVNT